MSTYPTDPQLKVEQVKNLIFRHPHAFPGGYEHALYLADGSRICRACALENWREIYAETAHPGGGDRSWGVLAVGIYWEGPPEECCQCGKPMPSEYGDPNETDERNEP